MDAGGWGEETVMTQEGFGESSSGNGHGLMFEELIR
jgi:hypothetical protein